MPSPPRFADLRKQSCAVAGKVVADHEMIRRVLQQFGQGCLAIEQRAAAQIPAVAVEQIEGVIDQVPPVAVERLIKQIKVRNPALIRHRDLAVQHRAAHGQHAQHLGDRPEASSSVVPGPGLQADAPALDIGDDPVSIVLDLMDPSLASGRRGRGTHELRGDPHRHDRAAGERGWHAALVIAATLRRRKSRGVTASVQWSRLRLPNLGPPFVTGGGPSRVRNQRREIAPEIAPDCAIQAGTTW
jgi:hypothetical protein